MRVKSTRQNVSEINVNCRNCSYSENEIFFGQTLLSRRNNVKIIRSKARYHAQKTGHEVEIETTYITVYKPKDGNQ